jgi:hypothetical protein
MFLTTSEQSRQDQTGKNENVCPYQSNIIAPEHEEAIGNHEAEASGDQPDQSLRTPPTTKL